MTGSLRIQSNNITDGETPSSNAWGAGISGRDSSLNNIMQVQPVDHSNGQKVLYLSRSATYSGAVKTHALRIGFDANGNSKVWLAQSAWLEALELESASGDSGWKTLTLNSAFTLYAASTPVQYRKVGKLVEIFGVIKPTAEIAAGGTANIGTLPAGYYPNVGHSFVCQGSSINRWMLTVSGGGVLSFSRYGASSGAAAPTNAWLPFNVTFFVD